MSADFDFEEDEFIVNLSILLSKLSYPDHFGRQLIVIRAFDEMVDFNSIFSSSGFMNRGGEEIWQAWCKSDAY